MPHFRERIDENRSKMIGLKLTQDEIDAIDELREDKESRSEFLAAAIDAYKLKRKKRILQSR